MNPRNWSSEDPYGGEAFFPFNAQSAATSIAAEVAPDMDFSQSHDEYVCFSVPVYKSLSGWSVM
jgi:hypothetical protein